VERSLELAREIEDRRAEALSALSLGNMFLLLGRHDAAREMIETTRLLAEETEDPRTGTTAIQNLAELAIRQGDLEEALRRSEEAVALQRASDHRHGHVTALLMLGDVQRRRGEASAVRATLTELLERATSDGERDAIVLARAQLALLDPAEVDAARASLADGERYLTQETRVMAHHLLWQATGVVVHLDAAHRAMKVLCSGAPEEDWSSMLENVPLYRDIVRAWAETGVEEGRS